MPVLFGLYPHFYFIYQKQFPTARYIAHDTICKYWPWLQKLDGITAERQKPILSVMHAKSHSWNCQVSSNNFPLALKGCPHFDIRLTTPTSWLTETRLAKLVLVDNVLALSCLVVMRVIVYL